VDALAYTSGVNRNRLRLGASVCIQPSRFDHHRAGVDARSLDRETTESARIALLVPLGILPAIRASAADMALATVVARLYRGGMVGVVINPGPGKGSRAAKRFRIVCQSARPRPATP
jgi:hypothetical protein